MHTLCDSVHDGAFEAGSKALRILKPAWPKFAQVQQPAPEALRTPFALLEAFNDLLAIRASPKEVAACNKRMKMMTSGKSPLTKKAHYEADQGNDDSLLYRWCSIAINFQGQQQRHV